MGHTPKTEFSISEDDAISIKSIARKIANGDCVLFLGAGVNYSDEGGVIYPPEQRPPTGKELSLEIDKELRVELKELYKLKEEEKFLLNRTSQYYQILFGRKDLCNLLKKFIKEDHNPSPMLSDLAWMPFRYIMTTNYDGLFEKALIAEGKNCDNKGIYKISRDAITDNIEESKITKISPFIYKMHGDIGYKIADSISKDDREKMASIVITDEDYIHFILRMSDKEVHDPIPKAFTEAFTEKTILFIGYSLMDYNLRLMFKATSWGKNFAQIESHYSIDPFPDVSIRRLFSTNYKVNFIVEDAWKIVPVLREELEKILK